MKKIIGAIALTLAVPAIAQTSPDTLPHAANSPCQTMPGGQQGTRDVDVMHKSCPETMKHHEKMHRKEKTDAERLDAEVNGNGHQGHNH